MPSYVITGASRGLGYAFLEKLSQDPSNTVIGLVRNKAATDEKVQKGGLKNVHIIQADIVDVPALEKAAEETAKLTGGGVDVLINNAAWQSESSAFADMTQAERNLASTSADFTQSFAVNVLGVLNTTTAFLPLIRRGGSQKKVIAITSGMADLDLINAYGVSAATPYTVSKAALNALVAKYNAAYGRSEGILFLGISPGVVNTKQSALREEDMKGFREMLGQFKEYEPDFQGPISPAESAERVLEVVGRASVGEFGGGFVSHFGNKQWL